jgi:hypothetical protein
LASVCIIAFLIAVISGCGGDDSTVTLLDAAGDRRADIAQPTADQTQLTCRAGTPPSPREKEV